MNKLSAYLPVRNGFALDYCWQEAAFSLIEVSDELILCDSDSTDGTRDAMETLAVINPKIRVINYPWPTLPTYEQVAAQKPGPPGQPRMLIKWLNFCREHCRYPMQLTTDADEVLHPDSYPAIREAVAKMECRWFHRLHFWRDHRHITQDGKVVGCHVARLGPTEFEMPSDEMRPEGEPEIRKRATRDPRLNFFHYGFIRRPAAFFAKSKVMQPALCNSYDPRLEQAERENISWFDTTEVGELLPFNGAHPPIMTNWLRERGYAV